MTPDASAPLVSTPAKPYGGGRDAVSAVLDAGHSDELAVRGRERRRRGERVHPRVRRNEQCAAVGTELEPADRLRPVARGAFDVAVGRRDERDGAAGVRGREPAAVGREGQRRRGCAEPHGHALARFRRERRR